MANGQGWLDLSFPLSPDTPVFPGDPSLEVEQVASIAGGAGFNLKRYTLTGHVGTHIDAPAHVIADGDTIEQLSPQLFVGEVVVVGVPGAGAVLREQLEGLVSGACTRLFLRTVGERATDAQVPTRAYLDPSAAEWIVERGVRLLGVDSFSVDPVDSAELSAHRILLGNGIPVIEGLDLRHVPPGCYFVIALPLRIVGGDGSPARVLARPLKQPGSTAVQPELL